MTGSIYDWTISPDANATNDGDINWAEFQDPATVNNSARRMMGRIAEYIDDIAPIRASTGVVNTYTITAASTPVGATPPDGFTVAFKAHITNTGACTLYVNSFSGVPLRAVSGSSLIAGAIQAGMPIIASYQASTNEYLALGTGANVSAYLTGFQSVDLTARILPVGMILPWPTETIPNGWLECKGQAVSRTTYPELFVAYGTKYGVGDGSTTFTLPNYSGKFLRGWDHAAGADPDAATRTDRGDGTTGDHVGTKQAYDTKAHTHTFTGSALAAHGHPFRTGPGSTDTSKTSGGLAQDGESPPGTNNAAYTGTPSATSGQQIGGQSAGTPAGTNSNYPSSGGNETRPVNVSVVWCCLALPAAAAQPLDTGAKGSITLANGLNSDIAKPVNNSNRIVGPTSTFSVGGFTGGADGQPLRLYNTVAFAMTIVNEDASSTAANRIKTLTGSNVVLRSGTSFASLEYDASDLRWILVSTN